jgi:hypothetical protein
LDAQRVRLRATVCARASRQPGPSGSSPAPPRLSFWGGGFCPSVSLRRSPILWPAPAPAAAAAAAAASTSASTPGPPPPRRVALPPSPPPLPPRCVCTARAPGTKTTMATLSPTEVYELHVRVVEARDLKRVVMMGSMNVYAQLTVPRGTRKTPPAGGDDNPVFDAESNKFMLLVNAADTLVVALDSHSITGDALIGRVLLPLSGLADGAVCDKSYALHDAAGERAGEVHLRMQLMHGGEVPIAPPRAMPPPPAAKPPPRELPPPAYAPAHAPPPPAMPPPPPQPQQYAQPPPQQGCALLRPRPLSRALCLRLSRAAPLPTNPLNPHARPRAAAAVRAAAAAASGAAGLCVVAATPALARAPRRLRLSCAAPPPSAHPLIPHARPRAAAAVRAAAAARGAAGLCVIAAAAPASARTAPPSHAPAPTPTPDPAAPPQQQYAQQPQPQQQYPQGYAQAPQGYPQAPQGCALALRTLARAPRHAPRAQRLTRPPRLTAPRPSAAPHAPLSPPRQTPRPRRCRTAARPFTARPPRQCTTSGRRTAVRFLQCPRPRVRRRRAAPALTRAPPPHPPLPDQTPRPRQCTARPFTARRRPTVPPFTARRRPCRSCRASAACRLSTRAALRRSPSTHRVTTHRRINSS